MCLGRAVVFPLCVCQILNCSAQKNAVSLGLNYGFQNLNSQRFNSFFSSFNTVYSPASGFKMLSTSSYHGVGFIFNYGILAFGERTGGFVFATYEYNNAGWKNSATFHNKIIQNLRFRSNTHKFYFEFGADLRFIFFSAYTGVQLTQARLFAENHYPTGNAGMSLDNPVNGVYSSPNLWTVPFGLRTGLVMRRTLRLPVSFEYNLPVFSNNVLLRDKLIQGNDGLEPYKTFPSGFGETIRQNALKGWTIRFGLLITIVSK